MSGDIQGFSKPQVSHESAGDLPFMIWPSAWIQSRRFGLRLSVFRLTLALARHRLHVQITRRTAPPPTDLSDPALGVKGLSDWMTGLGFAAEQRALTRWLQDSEWAPIAREGAANLHYGRIVIAAGFAAELTAKTPDTGLLD